MITFREPIQLDLARWEALPPAMFSSGLCLLCIFELYFGHTSLNFFDSIPSLVMVLTIVILFINSSSYCKQTWAQQQAAEQVQAEVL